MAPEPMMPRLARVVRRRRELPGTVTLEIEDPEADGFAPGQFNMLYAFGVGEVPISFSGDPAAGACLHTLRNVGAVTGMLAGLEVGATLGVRGPFGAGWPMDEALGKDVVVIVGGLGLAPVRPVLYRLLAERERYGQVVLLYGTRSPEDILFGHEIEAWRRRLDIDILVTVDHATGNWHGHVGVVPALISRADFDPLHAIAFVCGPEVMMRFSAAALLTAGLPDTAIYLSMERNMKCAIGQCGHCQFGTVLVCRDGPVFRYDRLRTMLATKEI